MSMRVTQVRLTDQEREILFTVLLDLANATRKQPGRQPVAQFLYQLAAKISAP